MTRKPKQPRDTHWPPDGVRDLGTTEPHDAGDLIVPLGDVARPKRPTR
jgi:hypothetical protein